MTNTDSEYEGQAEGINTWTEGVSDRMDFILRGLDDATDRARLAPNTELALVAICDALGWVSMAIRSLHTPPQEEPK
jgi:hypothetical protein